MSGVVLVVGLLERRRQDNSPLQTSIPPVVWYLIKKEDIVVGKLCYIRLTDEESRWFGGCTGMYQNVGGFD